MYLAYHFSVECRGGHRVQWLLICPRQCSIYNLLGITANCYIRGVARADPPEAGANQERIFHLEMVIRSSSGDGESIRGNNMFLFCACLKGQRLSLMKGKIIASARLFLAQDYFEPDWFKTDWFKLVLI